MITTPQSRIEELTSAGSWGDTTLHALLEQHARENPDRLAVKDQPNRQELTGDPARSLSWAELARASDNLARQLQAAGVGEDDCLLVQLPNVAELLVVYYALSKLGAIISPVPVQYGSHELQLMAGVIEAKAMISLRSFREGSPAATAREALPNIQVLAFGDEISLDPQSDASFEPVHSDANRVLSICWTSGTTGTPKGVPRSHNMWLATARATMNAGGYSAEDILLNPFPLVNMAALGGFLFPSALLGCSIVLHHPLDPGLFLQQMQDEKISFTIAPPALLNQLAKSDEMWNQFDFSALRRVGSGSAPLAPWMIDTFGSKYGKEVVNFYGSNEGISLFSTPEATPDPEVRAAMFLHSGPGIDIETKVADPETGTEITATGERGELLISGATVFDGYYAHDNVEVFSDDGYFRTGDLVEICGDNGEFYRIVGRCKDIINRGGMKISPAELDVALEKHPAVTEAAVCAYPDERLGEKICACLVLGDKQTAPSMEELQAYMLEQGFAKFKLPERIELFDQLPRNAVGKVQRFALQDSVTARPEEPTQ